ncbi:MAG: hypothetical protein LBC18_14260, partial [Opitutaceae bacterium]|nr:hypothetical protein [Opitutaceae bacterium]
TTTVIVSMQTLIRRDAVGSMQFVAHNNLIINATCFLLDTDPISTHFNPFQLNPPTAAFPSFPAKPPVPFVHVPSSIVHRPDPSAGSPASAPPVAQDARRGVGTILDMPRKKHQHQIAFVSHLAAPTPVESPGYWC